MFTQIRIIPRSVYDYFCAQLEAKPGSDGTPVSFAPPPLREPTVSVLRPNGSSTHERRLALSERLHREFPLVFTRFLPDKRPLALDIYTQLCSALPETDPTDLLRVVQYYTNDWNYLKVIGKSGVQRVNLDGSNAGAVTAAEAKAARDQLQLSVWRKEEGRQ
jgi:hypothetical protein